MLAETDKLEDIFVFNVEAKIFAFLVDVYCIEIWSDYIFSMFVVVNVKSHDLRWMEFLFIFVLLNDDTSSLLWQNELNERSKLMEIGCQWKKGKSINGDIETSFYRLDRWIYSHWFARTHIFLQLHELYCTDTREHTRASFREIHFLRSLMRIIQ